MVNDIIKSLQGDLDKGIDAFKRDLAKVRTGRASLGILDGVRVDYYGTPTPLNQVGTLAVPDPTLITIQFLPNTTPPLLTKLDQYPGFIALTQSSPLTKPAVVAVEPGIARPRTASPASLIDAREAPIPALPPARTALRPAFLGHRPPRPAPPRMPAPDGALPAEARIASVVGTASDSRQRELVTGTADQIAQRILRLLEERGLGPAP